MANLLKIWWPGTELNRRRQPFQGCSHPKLSVDSATYSSTFLPVSSSLIGTIMEPQSEPTEIHNQPAEVCLYKFKGCSKQTRYNSRTKG